MKIRDTRDNRVFEGELVATIPAGQQPTSQQIAKYYGVLPHHKGYGVIAKPVQHDRIVLDRGDGEDPHYYIIPKYPFYEVIDDGRQDRKSDAGQG